MIQTEFDIVIKDILTNSKFMELKKHVHHLKTSRMQHSLDVARITYKYCLKNNIKWTKTVEAALLHDFFVRDWRITGISLWKHLWLHPQEALENAKVLMKLNAMQEDAILNHMWPVSKSKPKTREAMIVCMADKYCSTMEIIKPRKQVPEKSYGLQNSDGEMMK